MSAMLENVVPSLPVSEYIVLSILSGCLGAVSGVLGKLGLDQNQLEGFHGTANLALRVTNIGGTLLLNCLMLTTYTKALSMAPTAAEASLLNTASNLMMTAVMSVVIFEEHLSLQWLSGAVLVCLGMALVIQEEEKEKKS